MREPNDALRAARERLPSLRAPGESLTRAELADAVNGHLWRTTGVRYELDDHLIGKWERGVVHWPIAPYRAALRAVLGMAGDAELGFHPPTDVRRRRPARPVPPTPDCPGPSSAGSIVRDGSVTTELDLITRRDALRGAAVLGGSGLLEPLTPWLDPLAPDVHPPVVAVSARRGAFAAAEVEAVEAVTAAFRGWRSSDGLGRTAVVGQLSDVLERLRDAPSGALTDRVVLAAAELAKISGSMAFDAGAHRSAQDQYVLAARLAKAGGEPSFGAVALAALARVSFDTGTPGDGLEVIALAQRGTARSGTPALRAMLATRQAWGHAQRGEAHAFAGAVDAAGSAHAEVCSAAEPRWLHGLDTAELYGVIGARYRDLARYDHRHATSAVTYIGRALALRDPSRTRNRAFDLVSLARVHLLTGEHDHAAATVREALPLLDPARPGRLARRLRDWHREAAPYVSIAAVRRSRDDIAHLTASAR